MDLKIGNKSATVTVFALSKLLTFGSEDKGLLPDAIARQFNCKVKPLGIAHRLDEAEAMAYSFNPKWHYKQIIFLSIDGTWWTDISAKGELLLPSKFIQWITLSFQILFTRKFAAIND